MADIFPEVTKLIKMAPFVVGDRSIELVYKKEKDTVHILIHGMSSWDDLKYCMDFFVAPYKHMKHKWYAHRGFVKDYKSIQTFILNLCKTVKVVNLYGLSRGAAIATLAYEDIRYNFPDLSINGYGFASPSVIWMPTKETRKLFENFNNIKVLGDPVTLLPPWWIGFSHVGNKMIFKGKRNYFSMKNHSYEYYKECLEAKQ